MDLNNCTFSGRLGRDPDVRNTANGASMTTFSLAVNTGYGDHKTTLWIDCTAFGKIGEPIARYAAKGKRIIVAGEIGVRHYDGRDGSSKTSITLNVRSVSFIDWNEGEQHQERQPAQSELSDEPAPF